MKKKLLIFLLSSLFATLSQAQCNMPINVNTLVLSSTSSRTSWTTTNFSAYWQVVYDTAGFPPNSISPIFAGSNPLTLTNLTPETDYDIYVRAICGNSIGDTSAWSLVSSFRTPCPEPTSSYSYTFDNYLDGEACWYEAVGTPNNIQRRDSDWDQGGFGTDGVYGAAQAPISYHGARNDWLISRGFDLGNVSTDFQLEFDIALSSVADPFRAGQLYRNDTIAVIISTDNGHSWQYSNIVKLWTRNNVPALEGEHVTIDLSSYTGIIRVGFYVTSRYSRANSRVYIDNFTITSCKPPRFFISNRQTDTSYHLSWTGVGPATTWELEYGIVGFVPGTGTTVQTNMPSINITGLTPSMNYDCYIRSVCGTNNQSTWVGPLNIFTTCMGPIIPPYKQEFSSSTFCWRNQQGPLTTSTTLQSFSSGWTHSNFGFTPHGSRAASISLHQHVPRHNWRISPSIDLGNGSTNYQVEFDVTAHLISNSFSAPPSPMATDDTLALVISLDDGVTWEKANVLRYWTNGSAPSYKGERVIVDLTGYTGVVKFGFYTANTINNSYVLVYVDNFGIFPIPEQAPDLMITEVMYNAPKNYAFLRNFEVTDPLEFIEIYNKGTTPIPLEGMRLDGINYNFEFGKSNANFTFPNDTLAPGAYYILASDTSFFESVYGFLPNGRYDGELSDTGAVIFLLDPLGATVDYVHYKDGPGWPIGTAPGGPDRGGASIVFCDPTLDNSMGTHWSTSINPTGDTVLNLRLYASPGHDCSDVSDVAAVTFIGYNHVYCQTDSIAGFVAINNLLALDAQQVAYTITLDGNIIQQDTLGTLPAFTSQTIPIGYALTDTLWGRKSLQIIVTSLRDIDARNDTLTTTILFSRLEASIAVATPPACANTTDGVLIANALNGIGTLRYHWSTSDASITTHNLTAGQYAVTITDVTGCNDSASYTLQGPPPIVTTLTTSSIDCAHDSTGSVALVVTSGGILPFTYQWSNGATSSNLQGLTAGTYSLLLTDSTGCQIRDTAVLTAPLPLTWSPSITPVTCHGDTDGMIDVTPISGGVPPYVYTWNNAATTGSISNISAGNYTLTVVDANGCAQTATYSVPEPNPLNVLSIISNNSTVNALPSGGRPPYTFLWSANAGNQTTAVATNLLTNTIYTVTVTDVNGCTAIDSVNIVFVGTTNPYATHQLTLFPNPSSGVVFVNLDLMTDSPVQIDVINTVGQLVYQRKLSLVKQQQITLPLQHLSNGCYGVQFRIGTEYFHHSLIIQRP